MAEHQYFDRSEYRNLLMSNLNEKLISRIHKQVKRQNSICGVWSDEENLIYAQFIEDHPFEFETAEKRRRFKVFQRMAMHLTNRTAIQCRSHNQKMVKLAGTILNVPKYIKKRIFPRGKKAQDAICIKEEENEGPLGNLMEKPTLTKNLTDQNESSKQPIGQKRFELPLKLCIEIKSENMEEY